MTPDIDSEPTPAERAAAEALITSERALVPDDPHHALLPPAATPNFSPAIQAELDRAAAKQPLSAIDLSRYEEQDDGLPTPAEASSDPAAARARLEMALSRAGASATYLAGRRAHLALLDSHGRNAWLVGNWQLEGELRALERELAAARREVDVVTVERRAAQDGVAAELRGLEETWRRGVGRVLETEVAAEGLRQEVLEQRRRMA